MKRSLVFFVLALFLMAGQLARAQSKQQIIDSLQQRIEELQHQVDTATFITGLEKLVNYLDWEFRETTDREAFLSQTKPKFQGGDANTFSVWVNKHLQQQFDENNVPLEGRVTLCFTVSETGEVTNVKVLRSVHPKLEEEAVRVVSSSPKWLPATSNGTPIRTVYTFPVVFQAR